MAETNTSFYPTTYNPQPNALQTFGQYQGLANAQAQNALLQQELPLMQQHVQQAQILTQRELGRQRIGQIVAKNTDPNTGKVDWLGVKTDGAKDPLVAQSYDQVENIADPQLVQTFAGYDNKGAEKLESLQNVQQKLGGGGNQPPMTGPAANSTPAGGTPSQQGAAITQQADQQQPTAQQQPQEPPSIAGSLPPGFSTPLPTSRANYDQVSKEATTAPGQTAAYNEVINLANNGVMSGTNLTRAYAAAARNDPFHLLSGATDETVKNQELQKWMSQGLLASGMPGSDARLQELQHGNLNPEQLTETLKEMAPFFKAVSEGALRKQDYYNNQTSGGNNLEREPMAKQKWDDNYDPRWVEFDDLPDKKAQRAFLVDHPDMIQKRQSHQNLQQMGVIGGFKE